MATKKERRAAAEAKHERFMESVRRDGELALKKERDRRERKRWEDWRDQHDKGHQKPAPKVEGCPLCEKGIGLSRSKLEQEQANAEHLLNKIFGAIENGRGDDSPIDLTRNTETEGASK